MEGLGGAGLGAWGGGGVAGKRPKLQKASVALARRARIGKLPYKRSTGLTGMDARTTPVRAAERLQELQ